MNPVEIEYASRLSWPALEEVALPGGVLRYAAGVSRRSNSLNVCQQEVEEVECLVARAQKFFAARNLPTIFKIPESSRCHELDGYLAGAGYQNEAYTHVLCKSLRSSDTGTRDLDSNYQHQTRSLAMWLSDWYAVKELPAEQIPIHEMMLTKIAHPTRYLVASDASDQAVATAMGVATDNSLAILGVATHIDHRQRGIAASLVDSLLCWGKSAGANYAHLQVEAENVAALQLYRKLGFFKLYSYWYRVQPHSLNGIK